MPFSGCWHFPPVDCVFTARRYAWATLQPARGAFVALFCVLACSVIQVHFQDLPYLVSQEEVDAEDVFNYLKSIFLWSASTGLSLQAQWGPAG